ncbi:hypothetical protein [Fictibacillus fluitans]|uniref:Uncharacterized protein n=1 Tax=Fictibacillus fluitans TaxID=3058422 RepID=A0ABT8HQL9_9BACL|nr:hypothetical protein [Fictibacillus sp. NE201]MDN4523062.1 hypothetical protein [Fictibacillus sp. NE201]
MTERTGHNDMEEYKPDVNRPAETPAEAHRMVTVNKAEEVLKNKKGQLPRLT